MKFKNLIRITFGMGGLLLLVALAFVVYGIILGKHTLIRESLIIEAPVDVVWNNVHNFDEHSKWMKGLSPLYNYKHSARQIRYNIGDRTLMVNQQVRTRENAYSIDFIRIGHERYGEIENLNGSISLHSLADGTTELTWIIDYTLDTISPRVINALFVRPKLKRLIHINALALKAYIEH